MSNRKITVIGAGAVGSATAFALALKKVANEIVIVDINEDKALGECDIVFGGVLTDVYQRTMTTEKIEAHVS